MATRELAMSLPLGMLYNICNSSSTRVERHDSEGPAETEDHEDHGNLPTNV